MYVFPAVWNKDTLGADSISDLNGLDRSRARLEQLTKAVRSVNDLVRNYARDEGLPRNQLLTVFAAPEYFFARKPSMSTRFVEQGEKQHVVSALQKLSQECANVLIIPGTVPWWRKATKGEGDAARIANASARITNAQGFGGFKGVNHLSAAGWSHTEPGRNSHIGTNWNPPADPRAKPVQLLSTPNAYIASNTAYIALNGTVLKYHKIGNFREVNREQGTVVFAPGNQLGSFTVESRARNLDFGFEICRDHAIGVFSHSTAYAVDVHVIVSATVGMVPTNIAAKAGTVVVHADSKNGTHTQTAAYPPTVAHFDVLDSGIAGLKVSRMDMFGGVPQAPLSKVAQASVPDERFTLTSGTLDSANSAR